MIPVAEADRLLAGFAQPWPSISVPLAEATGRILRENLCADRAYPAQDRSRMDGIALASAAWEMGVRRFPVAGVARAGDPRGRLDDAAGCVEIMTGAAVPEGCDTVIPYEDLNITDGIASVREDLKVKPGQFVHREGSDCAAGDVLVAAGARVNAAIASIAASVGKGTVLVARRPRIAVVATGDELVAFDATPHPHQVRASHGAALHALLSPWAEVSLRRCGDDPSTLAGTLREAIVEADMLLVTGGVSMGKFDGVPDALAALGVTRVFHKVAQKPGKPLWFGVSAGGTPKLVFGLPGNPVSALVCARRYVLPLLWAKSGWSPRVAAAQFEGPHPASKLTHFVPVRLGESDGIRRAIPAAINGSGDFAGLGASDGFVEISASDPSTGLGDRSSSEAGEKFPFFPWIS